MVRPGEKRHHDGRGQPDEEQAFEEKPDPRVERALLGQMHRSHRTATTRRRRLPGCGVRESCNTHAMRVLVADDHRLMLDGVRRALEADGGFEIVGETQDGAKVVDLVAKTQPDLVLLDVRMPNVDGLACLDEIHRRYPDDQGRDALGVDLAGADRCRAPPRRQRLPREERRPERPALDAAPGDRGQRLQRVGARRRVRERHARRQRA